MWLMNFRMGGRCFLKLHTRWKMCKHANVIGHRFFDGGEYGLGYFTVEKVYKCKEYCRSAETLDGSHWFSKNMAIIKTDAGLKYRVPFFPWAKVVDDSDKKPLSKFYDELPWA